MKSEQKPQRLEKREPMYTLLAPTLAEHLNTVQRAHRATDWYLRSDCRFVKVLVEHIISAGPKTCIIDKEGRRLSYHRGTGAAVRVQKPVFHMALDDEPASISFELEVGFEPLVDDPEYEHDLSRDLVRTYHLNIPVDLEENFTQEKFDLWRTKIRDERVQEQDKVERKALEKLIRRHPLTTLELISKLKLKG